MTLALVQPKIPQKVIGHRISCAQSKLPTAITSLYMANCMYGSVTVVLLLSFC